MKTKSLSERVEDGTYERVTVIDEDGDEVEVFNWVTIEQPARVRGHNLVVEKFEARIGAGDSSMKPEAVTDLVAAELYNEFGIEVEDHDIRVIDPTAEEVDLI